MDSLTGKVILITGASTGIGGFTAGYMSKFKPKLVLVARSTGKLKEVQQLCEEGGCGKGNVLIITADMAKPEDLTRIIAETISAFGQLDVLVNNAASLVVNDMQTTTLEGYERTMAVNVRAPFFLSQAALPHLKKTKGSIINISSVAAHRPFLFTAAYCISKAALEHFTRILAFEVARDGIRVNSVTVGATVTDTQEKMFKVVGREWDPDVVFPGASDYQLLGGACSMEDVAKVVTFLASELSSAMTGTNIPVERGYMLTSSCSLPEVMKALSSSEWMNSGDQNARATEENLKDIDAMQNFWGKGEGPTKSSEGKGPAKPSDG